MSLSSAEHLHIKTTTGKAFYRALYHVLCTIEAYIIRIHPLSPLNNFQHISLQMKRWTSRLTNRQTNLRAMALA